MAELLDDALLPTDREGLEAELAEIDKRLLENQAKIKSLMDAENPSDGVFFAAEIHEAKQRSMLLRYQKDLRTARLNALNLGFSS